LARTSPALLLALAAGLAASLAGVLLLTLLREPAPSIAPSGGPTPEAGERSEAELAPVSTGAGRSAPDAPAAETPAVRLGTASPEEPAATATPSISIWGVVRERATGEGLFACAVRLGSAEPVLTDAAGRFVIQLEDIAHGGEDLRVVRVTRAERGVEEVLFLGTVRVQPGLEILVEPPVVLRLHIVDDLGKAVRAVRVAAFLDSERLREVRWFVASTRQSSDLGRFEIRARAPLPPPDALVLQVELDANTTVRARCNWAELTSDEGATVVVDICSVRLTLVESDGSTPVTEASLRIAASVAEDPEPSIRAYLEHMGEGPLEILLPRMATAIEVAVGAPGHAPLVAQRDSTPCGETWTLALARLGSDDILAGRVLDAAGQPVAEAYVSCNPPTHDEEVVVAASGGVRSDGEGRFTLSFPRGQVAELRAYHRDHGMTPEVEVLGGERDIVLRFIGAQRLTVAPRFPAAAGLAASGHPFEWVLSKQDGPTLSGSERSAPFVIEEIWPGEHRLFLVAVEGSFFASAPVSVFPAIDPRVEPELQPARRARGRVLQADGSPAPDIQVRIVDPAWPALLVKHWGTAETDAGGSFELLVGHATEAMLAFSRNGRDLMRTLVASETPLEIRLP